MIISPPKFTMEFFKGVNFEHGSPSFSFGETSLFLILFTPPNKKSVHR